MTPRGSWVLLCLPASMFWSCAAPVRQPDFPVRPWQGRASAEPFRLAPPASGPEADLPPQSVEEAVLPKGVRILLVSRHDLPLVHVAWVVRRGAADGAPGVAELLVALLAADHKSWTLRLTPESLQLLRFAPSGLLSALFQRAPESLRRRSFSERAFASERARLHTLESTTAPSDSPRLVELASRLIYPEGHAYRMPERGGTGTSAVELAQLAEFMRMNIAPDQSVVVAVGDVTMDRLKSLAADACRGWKGTAAPRAPSPPAVASLPKGAAISLIDQPVLTQSRILVASPGTSAFADDFEALELLNEILGGAPTTSRMNSLLREDLGYTYQAISSVEARRGPGMFLLEQNVAKESTVEALRVIMRQIERLRRENVSEEELATAKARLRSSVLLGYDSFQATLHELAAIAELGLPSDHSTRRLARIRSLTVKDVRNAATKYLAAERLRTVIVGDVAALKKPLAGAGLGEVRVIEMSPGSP